MSLASSSLISLLNNDVLIHIFHLNTYTPETELGWGTVRDRNPSALNVARHTSQVCRSWRQLMLQSPTIWANIIDVERLRTRKAHYHWIKEVLRRTGDLNLSVYGTVSLYDQILRMPTLIIPLLEEIWHRVRRFNISVSGEYIKRFWDIFWTRPAPNLEQFIIHGHISPPFETIRKDGLMMFSGSAPMLRRIHFPHLRFDPTVTWLPRLLSITLTGSLTLIDALKLAASCPLLESLELDLSLSKDDLAEEIPCTQQIHLQDLRRLSITSNMMQSLILLSEITPKTNCGLILSISTVPDLLPSEIFHGLLKIVSQYAKVYFHTYSTEELTIDIAEAHMMISSKSRTKVMSFGQPDFHVNLCPILSARQSIGFQVVNAFLSILAGIPLNIIRKFEFKLRHPSWKPETDQSIQIFRSLASITKITLTPSAIRAFNDLSKSVSLFPYLVEVTLMAFRQEKDLIAFKEAVRRFISLRIEAGNPVRMLCIALGPAGGWNHRDSWDFREFDDLRCFFKYPQRRLEYLTGPYDSDEIEQINRSAIYS